MGPIFNKYLSSALKPCISIFAADGQDEVGFQVKNSSPVTLKNR